MTGSEFYTYVLNVFKRTDKETEVYEAITDALRTISQSYPFEDYKIASYTGTLASEGDYSFDLPSDFDHMIGEMVMVDSGGWAKDMHQITREVFQTRHESNLSSNPGEGYPEEYCIYGGTVYVGPVPQGTNISFRFDYTTTQEDEITSGTLNVPFSALNRKMLRHLTLANLYSDLEEFDLEKEHMSSFQLHYDILTSKEDKNVAPHRHQAYNDLG